MDEKTPNEMIYCIRCKAWWGRWDDGGYSLFSPRAGDCCDNRPMTGDGLVPYTVTGALRQLAKEVSERGGQPFIFGGPRSPKGEGE